MTETERLLYVTMLYLLEALEAIGDTRDDVAGRLQDVRRMLAKLHPLSLKDARRGDR